jgi:predicted nucleotidyltransferase
MLTDQDVKRKREEHRVLLEQALQDVLTQLRAIEGVCRVSLFGSYVQGRRDLFTDLDILVVMDTSMSFVERLRFLYSKVNVPVDLDMLCYTPQEFQSLKGTGRLRRILQEERVLYERQPL